MYYTDTNADTALDTNTFMHVQIQIQVQIQIKRSLNLQAPIRA